MKSKIVTPWRVAIVAAALGIGTAIVVSMQTPPAPPDPASTAVPSSGTPQVSTAAQVSTVAGPPTPTADSAAPLPIALAAGQKRTTPTGLTIVEVKAGTGPAAKSGDNLLVHYRGRLYFGGKQFDSSYDRGEPMSVNLGTTPLIPGFVEGLTGMQVGAKREVVIPPGLGYGEQGAGNGVIPPNATLVFDLELMAIQPPTPQ